MHVRTKIKNTIRFWIKNTKLDYNYCQGWQTFKSQIIKSKSSMAGIIQDKPMPYFHLVSRKFEWIRKVKKELVKQIGNKNNIN